MGFWGDLWEGYKKISPIYNIDKLFNPTKAIKPLATDLFEDISDITGATQQREDYLKQQQYVNEMAERQQSHAEYVAANASQIRAADLLAAGLHPALAAGGAAATTQGHLPSNQQPPGGRMNTMQQALFGAQLRESLTRSGLTAAETSRIRQQTALEQRRFDEIELPQAGFAAERHSWAKLLAPLEREAKRVGIDTMIVDKGIKEAELRFIKEHGSKMPVRGQRLNDFLSIVDYVFLQLGVSRQQRQSVINKFGKGLEDMGGKIYHLTHPKVNPVDPFDETDRLLRDWRSGKY